MKTGLKINYLTIAWIAFYVFLLVLFFRQSFSYLDPDLGWHLQTGKQIVTELKLPQTNQINYTLLGSRWIDHEWLSNVITYEVYTHYGYIILTILFSLILLGSFLLLNHWLKLVLKEKFHTGIILALEVFGAFAIAPHTGIRIQMITILFLLIILVILEYYQRYKRWTLLLWLIPLFYFWACLHAGFLAGLMVLALFWGTKILERVINSKVIDQEKRLSNKELTTGIIISGAAFLSTLLTPYLLSLYSFLFDYRDTFYLNHISEWLPQWAYPYIYPQFIYLSWTLVIIVLYLIQARHKSTKKIELWPLILTFVLLVMAVKSRRHFPLFFVASIPFIAGFIIDYLKLNEYKQKELPWMKTIISGLLILCLFLSAVSIITTTKIVKDPFVYFCESGAKQNPGAHLYPCAATEFLKTKTEYQDYRLLNNFGWGGYLIWAYPERKLFIDGRGPQAPYKNHSILAEYYDIWDPKQTEAKLAEHDIRLVLTQKRPGETKLNWFQKNFMLMDEAEISRNLRRDYLLDYLETNSDWKLIYQDSISVLYLKK